MIDDDKIVKAASELCDYGSIHDSEYRIEGFKKCAKWMQEEFLNDLWHDVFEERIPCNKKVIVEYTYEGGMHYKSIKIPDDIQWVRGFLNEKRLRRWLYVDDLLPKEGGEQ